MIIFSAADDITQLKEIKSMIEDLSAIRQAKINKYLDEVPADGLTLNLNNICAREHEQIRPFVSEVYSLKLEVLTNNFANYRANNQDNQNVNMIN